VARAGLFEVTPAGLRVPTWERVIPIDAAGVAQVPAPSPAPR